MTNHLREWAARRYRELLDAGTHGKLARLTVKREMRVKNRKLPFSRSSLYLWCAHYGVSTR